MSLRFYNIFKAFGLTKQPVPDSKLDKNKQITKWEEPGGNNNFPQVLLQTVYDSPSGSAAMDVWSEFTSSSGFKDESLNQIQINSEQKMLLLEQLVCQDVALLDGFAVHVGYNALGQPTEFNHLPFESTRLGLLNDKGKTKRIYFNPYYGIAQSYDKKYDKWYYPYNPSIVKDEMQKHAANEDFNFPYPGQVFWFSIEKPLARVYPTPFYNSCVNWMRVDAKIQEFHERNIDNNFLMSVLINVYGNPDDPAGPPEDPQSDGTGSRDQLETNEEVFNQQLRNLTGSKNAGGALVNWYTKEDEKVTFEEFPNNANDDLFNTLQDTTNSQIATGTKVPRILISIAETGKLGDTQDIINAIKVMQGRVKKKQMIVSGELKKLFQGFKGINEETDFTIPPHIPFDIIPELVFEYLTEQEVRTWINENFDLELDLTQEVERQQQTFEQIIENAIKKNGKHLHTVN